MPNTVPIDLTGINTFTGTASQLREKLRHAGDDPVVALVLPRYKAGMRDTIARTLREIAQLTENEALRREHDYLQNLVAALEPPIADAEAVRQEAKMIADARAAVFRSSEWLTAAEVARLAHLSASNPNAQPSRWKRDGRIFSIKPSSGAERFPRYGLDPASNYRPLKALEKIIEQLQDKDGWGLAYWFASVNSFLGGRRPQDVLVDAPAAVIAAAADDADGVRHG